MVWLGMMHRERVMHIRMYMNMRARERGLRISFLFTCFESFFTIQQSIINYLLVT